MAEEDIIQGQSDIQTVDYTEEHIRHLVGYGAYPYATGYVHR